MIHTVSEFDDWCGRVPGLVRVSNQHWANFDPADISYPDSDLAALEAIEPRSYWFAHRNAVITSVVRQHPPDGPIFDIGGGNGFVSQALATAGFPSVVVEPDHSGALASRRRGLPVVEAAFQNLAVPPGTLASAAMFDVLEHIEDDQSALENLRRLVVPGGMIYLAVPALSPLWSGEDVQAGHFRRYSRSSLSRVLKKAKFEPVRCTYFFSALAPAVFAFRTMPSLLGLRKGGNAATNSDEHELPAGLVGRLMRHSFAREQAAIDNGRNIILGSSLLMAASAIEAQ